MKRLFTVLLLICAACLSGVAQSADEQTILKLEEELHTAMLSTGLATFERLVDRDFLDVNQFGQRFDRADWITLFKTFKPGTMERSAVKVQIAGDTAHVNGKLREISTSNFGRPQYLFFLHVWVKRAEGWKLLIKQQQFDPTEGTVTPTGWMGQSNANFLVGADTETKHGGTASAFIKSKYAEGNSVLSSGLGQAIKADAYRGKRVRLSGWVKGAVAYGQAFPWMRVNAEHESGEILGFDNRLGDGFFVRPDWTSFSIVLDVPQQSATINFGFQLNGRGHVWLDDWTLEVVDASVPSTHQATSEAARKRLETMRATTQGQQQIEAMKKRLPTLPSAPVNLDFETPGKP